jgi:hypothetical protein
MQAWADNRRADLYCKRGARLHEVDAQLSLAFEGQKLWAKRVVRWIAELGCKMGTSVPRDVEAAPLEQLRANVAKPPLLSRVADAGHALTWRDRRWSCTQCLRASKQQRYFTTVACEGGLGRGDASTQFSIGVGIRHGVQGPVARVPRGAEAEAAAALAAGFLVHLGHTLWHSGEWWWCSKCGASARARPRNTGLVRLCTPPRHAGRRMLQLLRQGMQPDGSARAFPCKLVHGAGRPANDAFLQIGQATAQGDTLSRYLVEPALARCTKRKTVTITVDEASYGSIIL